jgi:peroxiredoxin (alkyl hydroperoxide reductase subunit C)
MNDSVEITQGPPLGDPAPGFEVDIGGNRISLRDFRGRWLIIVTDPEELLAVFKTRTINYVLCKRRTKVIALGRGTADVQQAVRNPVKKYILRHNLTIIDDSGGKIGEAYGLPFGADREKGVFIVDPKGILRAKLYQPLAAERNFYDTLKLIDALQMTDGRKVRVRGGWRRKLNVVIRPKAEPEESIAG